VELFSYSSNDGSMAKERYQIRALRTEDRTGDYSAAEVEAQYYLAESSTPWTEMGR
jgi:hypothetical protein